MKLELGKIFIKDIQFADTTEIKDHVLYVSKKELTEVFLTEEKIKEVESTSLNPASQFVSLRLRMLLSQE